MIGGGLNSLIPQQPDKPEAGQVSRQDNASQAKNPAVSGESEIQNESPTPKELSLAPEEFFEDIKQETGQLEEASEHDFNPARKAAGHARKHHSGQAVFLIEADKIKPNPFQPRKNFDQEALKDLANSIREHGIIQPLIVSKIESDTDTGTAVEYQLIAGERRLMAAKIAGLERVPAIVRQTDHKAEHLEVAIIENLQRENLNSIETARAYARLSDEFGLTQREIAVRLGKSREVIANTLRLLSLPSEFQAAVSKNQINESQARLLLAIDDPVAQKQLFEEIIANNLTVREVRNRVKRLHIGNAEPRPGAVVAHDAEIKNLEEKLKAALGTEVKIEKKGDSGKIVISFYSPEEIYGLIHKINPNENI